MLLGYVFPLLLSATLVTATPVAVRNEPRQAWFPYQTPPCSTCFRSSWTQGPECKTDGPLMSSISRILNPPAEATATYTPSQWCSDYLRETQWSSIYKTSSAVSTYTDWTIEHLFVTTTDWDHPTSTMYCPVPSSGMECGWDSNTVAPWDQGQDFSVEKGFNSTECHQLCLERPACKAYRLQDGNSQCEIFNVGLGSKASNVINPTPHGSQWWDRNCQQHAPNACKTAAVGTGAPISITQVVPTSTPTAVSPSAAPTGSAQPLITPAPTPTRKSPHKTKHIAKRDAPFPSYFADLSYVWSSIYVTPACSCILSSNLPPMLSTTTSTVTSWTSSSTVFETFEDWFTVTETPRETTLYKSVN